MGNSPIVFPHVRRLKDLQRQRALAQEQLAWLDREIAKETGQTPPVPTPAPVRPAAANEIEAARAAEEIIAQYRKPGMNTEKDVKRGCYLYFILAMGLLVLATLVAYFFYTNPRR